MQKLLFMVVVMFTQIGLAQTAVNFTCNDCFGASHDLFTELDAGKVIVLCWVEPCGGCADASLISSTLVESFQDDYPDKVYLYLVDDFANTDCESLISWANIFGIHPTTFFSDASISMFDYGEPGMPKVVVVSDVNHQVFYNANFTVEALALEEAINNAIIATTTGYRDMIGDYFSVKIFPNPAKETVTVSLNLKALTTIRAEILDQTGRIVYLNMWNGLSEGPNVIELGIPSIEEGIYFLKLTDGSNTSMAKLVIVQ
jgi:hypothetical protein